MCNENDVLEGFSIQNLSLRWMVKPSNFQWKNLLEGKSIHCEIVKLEDFSFQKDILLAWKVFLPVPDCIIN